MAKKNTKAKAKVDTSECQKLSECSADSHTIGMFMDWLMHERVPAVELAIWREDELRLIPPGNTIEYLLAEYFKIDLDKLEKERQALLASIRDS